jgi:hypothetical protein
MLIDIYSKSSHSSRIALIATVALIAIVGSYDNFIQPHLQSLKAAQRYSDEMSSFSQKNKVLESKLKIQQLDLDKLAGKTAQMQEQIFSALAAQQFFTGLELIAREHNCVVTSLNQYIAQNVTDERDKISSAGISVQRASMIILGDYPSIVSFLAQMVDRPNKVVINPLTMSVRQDNSELLECSLIVTIYVLNEDNNKGADPNAQ